MPLQPATTLASSQVTVKIGDVYQARDTRLDRTVAINVHPEHVATDPDPKQRFEREASTIADAPPPPPPPPHLHPP